MAKAFPSPPPTARNPYPRLRRLMNHPATDLVVMLMILASVVGIVVETLLPDGSQRRTLELVGDGFIAVFVVELTLRYLVAPSKSWFFRTYWLDILAILPLMRAFRVFRLLRLLRLFRLGVLLDRRVSRTRRMFRRGLQGYLLVGVSLITLVLVGALAITILEGRSNADFATFQEALWWSVMSLVAGEPVGGEATTGGGRVIELLLMLGGVTVFAMFTGTFTAVLLQVVGDRTEEINMEIDDLTGHVLICGWKRGMVGLIAELQVDREIRAAGVVVVSDQETEPELKNDGIDPDRVFFLRGDHSRVEVLRRAGVERVSVAIIVPDKLNNLTDQDRDARSVLTALVIEKLNDRAFVVVELLNPDNEAYLRMAGVEEVLVADRHTGRLLGVATRNRGLMSTVRELINSQDGNKIFKLTVPSAWVGQPVGRLFTALKVRANATLLSLERADGDGTIQVNPPSAQELVRGDRIVYVATAQLEKEAILALETDARGSQA